MAQLSPRKNCDQLIRCFIEKFKDNEDVGLIIKVDYGWSDLFLFPEGKNNIKVALLVIYSNGKLETATTLEIQIMRKL